MPRANRLVEAIAEGFALVGGFVVVILMVMVTVDAIGRKVVAALPGALEFSEALMVPAVFLPLMFVQMKREHVYVDVVTAKLPIRVRAALDCLAALVGVVIFGFLTWLALIKAMDSFATGEYRVALIQVPIWPFRWIIPLGTGLLVFQLLLTAIHEGVRAFGREEPVEEQKELVPPA